ncbi:MAG TPA: TIGR01777 family oxidoreductase [Propionibacteriaceae bacterium]|nr:TIGR01777 family oxidoreductase [Propionibacteriaceae bacterium]
MRVAITGSTGLIGSALVQALRWGGDEVVRLVRHEARGTDERQVFPDQRRIEGPGLADVDAVVNLAGTAIAGGRWTEEYKRSILDSRIAMTETVVAALPADGRCQRFVSGSAIGYYGPTGDHAVDESASAGQDFLAGVVVAWEKAASAAPVPTALARTGHVMSPRGGYIGAQLLPFKLGLGGPVRDGRHWVSWISLDDEVAALRWLLASEETGPFNLTAPHPVTNARWTRAMGAALHRPTVIPFPVPVATALFGKDFVEDAMVNSQRILPNRLEESGFEFIDTEIEPALARLLRG